MTVLRKAARLAYQTNRALLDAEAIRRGRYPQRVIRRHISRPIWRNVNRILRKIG